MYDIRATELVVEGLTVLKELMPVLNDPTKIDEFIKGVAEAKGILLSVQEANERLAEVKAIEEININESARLEKLGRTLNEKDAALQETAALITEAKKENAAILAENKKVVDSFTAINEATELREKAVTKRETEAELAMAEATRQRDLYQSKISVLNQLEATNAKN